MVALKQLGQVHALSPSIYEGQVAESSAPGRLTVIFEKCCIQAYLNLVTI